MKPSTLLAVALVGCAAPALQADNPALTLYNDGFAVVRQSFPLELQQGENTLAFSGVTAHLEPQSVILRDPSGKASLAILEQSYRADPISQGLLLKHFEGQEIEFQRWPGDLAAPTVLRGRILRSGYQPPFTPLSTSRSGHRSRPSDAGASPVIEIDGQIHFGLPGNPIFPSLPDDSVMEPTLNWIVLSDRAVKSQAELAYLSDGFSWQADYNLTAEDGSDRVDLVGWISMENQSGTSFSNAKIKLIAGDVNRVADAHGQEIYELSAFAVADRAAPQVEQRSFDEYHLYSLPRPTTLLDRQIKQVEFIRAEDVLAKTVYVYDGAAINAQRYRNYNPEQLRQEAAFGTESSSDVWVMREIENTEENGLGIALPKGKTRFYREDTDGQLEFTGENRIDHTPKKETLRIYTGNAFDLVGERVRTDFQVDRHRFANESFEITLTNRNDEPATIRVVEHLYRWHNWEIQSNSAPFEKVDADTIAFTVELEPDSEKTLSYTAHYTW